MRKTSVTQFDFGSGELSPLSFGRTDTSEYASGLAYSKDFIPSTEGPISNRPGTQRYSEAAGSGASRMFGFTPSNDSGFLIELYQQGLRISQPFSDKPASAYLIGTGTFDEDAVGEYILYKEESNIQYFRKRIYSTPTGSPAPDYLYRYYEVTYNVLAGEFHDLVLISRLVGGSELSANTLRWGSGGWEDFFSTPADFHTTLFESYRDTSSTVTLYSEEDLSDVRYTSAGDVLYLTHPSYPPAILYPNTDGTWTIEPAPLTAGPFVEPSEEQKDIQLSIDDFTYQVSIYAQGVDFSVHSPGDYIAYQDNGDWVLAVYQSIDGANDRAIVEPVKSIASGLDASARVEYQATTTLQFLGAIASPTVSADKSLFSGDLAGAWFRFLDIGTSGTGQVVTWVKLTNYLGVDTAGAGFFYHGGTNPAEVDVFLTEPALTSVTEYSSIQEVRTTGNTGEQLNVTTLRSSADLFEYPRDEGRVVQIQFLDTVVNCTIRDSGTNTESKASVVVDYALPYNSDATLQLAGRPSSWRIGAFYTDNYPAACGIFNQRFVYAGTPSHPETVWNSRIDRYFDFSPRERDGSVLATTAFSFTLGGQKFAPIRWLYPGTELLIGTEGAFWTTGPRESVYAAGSFYLEKHDDLGSTLPPIKVGSVLLLVQYSGRQVYEIEYSDDQRTYRADDGTTVPNHLFRDNRVVDIQLQRTPNPLIWIQLEDGELVTLTPRWHRNTRSYALSRQGVGTVASLAPLYDPSSSRDVLYLTTTRGSDSYVERMSFGYHPTSSTDREGMLYLDSAYTVEAEGSKEVSTWITLEAYVGKSVTILLDDEVWKQDYILEALPLTTPPATKLTIGYRYEPTLQLLPLSNTSTTGNSGLQGRLRSIQGITAQLYRSWGMRHGPRIDGTLLQPGSMVEENFGNHDDVPKDVTLMTGSLKLTSSHRNQRDTSIWVQQMQPYPLNILSITVHGEVE